VSPGSCCLAWKGALPAVGGSPRLSGESRTRHPAAVSSEWPLTQYRLRREGGRFRRRYVVMGLSVDGNLDWEWEPIPKREVFRRLTGAGLYVTDIWPLITAADEETNHDR